ncbi:hypothetical protein [Methanoculleus sp. MH98A]|uniref:hypothetical protein n=1 Tax=Methanoculleus sp. MH98A TaxID=1495314 RepID=UPI0004A032A9|nr:hypothetical protein [Methanoculleus sp. MH98A]KDE54662.1 hypothetical protein EI28_12610 [Methanoculleus sp. MH98A]
MAQHPVLPGVCRGRVTGAGFPCAPATEGTAVEPEREPAAVVACIGRTGWRERVKFEKDDGTMRFSIRKMK